VTTVAGDITSEEGRQAALRACAAARHPGQQRRRPAAGRLPRLGPRDLDQGAEANMIAPILMIRAVVDA